MNDLSTHNASADAGIDLSQFHQAFYEEAGENLELMEQLLLNIDIAAADDELLNSIFRCAHSVKGGAATFGFNDVAELTHKMESLLDKLRRHELSLTAVMVDVLLESGDALKSQLARHQNGGEGEPVNTIDLLQRFRVLDAGDAPAPSIMAEPAKPIQVSPVVARTDGKRTLEMVVGPHVSSEAADSLVELFKDIVDLGSIEPLDNGKTVDGMYRFKIITASSDTDLLDLFTFHVSREQVKLSSLEPVVSIAQTPLLTAAPVATNSVAAAPTKSAPSKPASSGSSAEATTLRVAVEKVDLLINLVGELVITQAMLAQTSAKVDPALYQQMASGLADLERNTRDLQETVMSIRMIPMSAVFNRFPRMLRDLAAKLDKKVDFVTMGEATELDKGLVEKITDPLTHLVRNSCDHGIELPNERRAKDKPETGTITLAASHQGGSIVIEVRDDGKGLNRSKLIQKAREKGIHAPDDMTDSEVWSLIFAPGFSTAEVVTDVSGRGVGMDVVKKNITALGGTVEIESVEGVGMSVKVRLPLTLAIMDSMSVGVLDECYILPLASVVESFQISAESLKSVGGNGRVIQVRDAYLPVIALEDVFDIRRNTNSPTNPIMVIVESDGARMALLVDELLGQQQVVVKNLESNFRKVDYVSGATIMGDGQVALILDVDRLVRRSRH